MINDRTMKRYTTSSGIKVYKLPVDAFPHHVTNCYLVLDNKITLIDTASGTDESNKTLLACFDNLKSEFDENISLKDVERVIITHGHFDHFGGVNFVCEESGAELGIHELDESAIQHFRERLLSTNNAVHHFLNRSGFSEERVNKLTRMNKGSKDRFRGRRVDFTFDEGAIPDSSLVAYHVPGHCPGQVCMVLDDILFSADHILSRITPNQAPESITRNMGVGHYIQSLKKVREIDGPRIALAGHELEMENWKGRIDDTIEFHKGRLEKTYNLLEEPKVMSEISQGLFGKQQHYHVLLAMLETGAHLEYLYERGRLVIVNIDEVESDPMAAPRYVQSD